MSREHLDHHIRRYYGSQEVDARVLDRLKRLAALEDSGPDSDSPVGRRAFGYTRGPSLGSRVVVAAAAVLGLALLPSILFEFGESGTGGVEALAASILREVALNHEKNLKVEFSAIGYSRLREQMGELDFALRSPQRVASGKLQVRGGRYCSIQGRLAAQIKLEDEHGRILTLYQTGFDERFSGLPELRTELNGVQVRVWREGNLLFALAGSEL